MASVSEDDIRSHRSTFAQRIASLEERQSQHGRHTAHNVTLPVCSDDAVKMPDRSSRTPISPHARQRDSDLDEPTPTPKSRPSSHKAPRVVDRILDLLPDEKEFRRVREQTEHAAESGNQHEDPATHMAAGLQGRGDRRSPSPSSSRDASRRQSRHRSRSNDRQRRHHHEPHARQDRHTAEHRDRWYGLGLAGIGLAKVVDELWSSRHDKHRAEHTHGDGDPPTFSDVGSLDSLICEIGRVTASMTAMSQESSRRTKIPQHARSRTRSRRKKCRASWHLGDSRPSNRFRDSPSGSDRCRYRSGSSASRSRMNKGERPPLYHEDIIVETFRDQFDERTTSTETSPARQWPFHSVQAGAFKPFLGTSARRTSPTRNPDSPVHARHDLHDELYDRPDGTEMGQPRTLSGHRPALSAATNRRQRPRSMAESQIDPHIRTQPYSAPRTYDTAESSPRNDLQGQSRGEDFRAESGPTLADLDHIDLEFELEGYDNEQDEDSGDYYEEPFFVDGAGRVHGNPLFQDLFGMQSNADTSGVQSVDTQRGYVIGEVDDSGDEAVSRAFESFLIAQSPVITEKMSPNATENSKHSGSDADAFSLDEIFAGDRGLKPQWKNQQDDAEADEQIDDYPAMKTSAQDQDQTILDYDGIPIFHPYQQDHRTTRLTSDDFGSALEAQDSSDQYDSALSAQQDEERSYQARPDSSDTRSASPHQMTWSQSPSLSTVRAVERSLTGSIVPSTNPLDIASESPQPDIPPEPGSATMCVPAEADSNKKSSASALSEEFVSRQDLPIDYECGGASQPYEPNKFSLSAETNRILAGCTGPGHDTLVASSSRDNFFHSSTNLPATHSGSPIELKPSFHIYPAKPTEHELVHRLLESETEEAWSTRASVNAGQPGDHSHNVSASDIENHPPQLSSSELNVLCDTNEQTDPQIILPTDNYSSESRGRSMYRSGVFEASTSRRGASARMEEVLLARDDAPSPPLSHNFGDWNIDPLLETSVETPDEMWDRMKKQRKKTKRALRGLANLNVASSKETSSSSSPGRSGLPNVATSAHVTRTVQQSVEPSSSSRESSRAARAAKDKEFAHSLAAGLMKNANNSKIRSGLQHFVQTAVLSGTNPSTHDQVTISTTAVGDMPGGDALHKNPLHIQSTTTNVKPIPIEHQVPAPSSPTFDHLDKTLHNKPVETRRYVTDSKDPVLPWTDPSIALRVDTTKVDSDSPQLGVKTHIQTPVPLPVEIEINNAKVLPGLSMLSEEWSDVDDGATESYLSNTHRTANSAVAHAITETKTVPLVAPVSLPVRTLSPGRLRCDQVHDVPHAVHDENQTSRGPVEVTTTTFTPLVVQGLRDQIAILQTENQKGLAAMAELGLLRNRINELQTALAEKEKEIHERDGTIKVLKDEVDKLSATCQNLSIANKDLIEDADKQYQALQDDHLEAQQQLQRATRQLDGLRHEHGRMTISMENLVREEVDSAMTDKNDELVRLRAEVKLLTSQIVTLSQQPRVASPNAEFAAIVRSEDYFDSACQTLCRHVQQWVLRFSKASDDATCRLYDELHHDKIEARLDNTMLDGSDVDRLLVDRVRRRDVFMSVVSTMIWQYVFRKYLFGMDRSQRQKYKAQEEALLALGPARAAALWRVSALTELAKRPSFQKQVEIDHDAATSEIFNVLSTLLPPPAASRARLLSSLRQVLRLAIDLATELRTQQANYFMLPPMMPEYDDKGDLVNDTLFDANIMDERSGLYGDLEALQRDHARVKIVLFPLLVKKGDDQGEGADETVICPAQVLVTGAGKSKRDSKMGSRGSGNERSHGSKTTTSAQNSVKAGN